MQIIPSLAPLAYDGRRAQMFEGQIVAAPRIIPAGGTDPAHLLARPACSPGPPARPDRARAAGGRGLP